MNSVSTPERIERLMEEYRALVGELGEDQDAAKLRSLLVRQAEWTEVGSAAVVHLATHYGRFILSNALALAEALDVEDGEAAI